MFWEKWKSIFLVNSIKCLFSTGKMPFSTPIKSTKIFISMSFLNEVVLDAQDVFKNFQIPIPFTRSLNFWFISIGSDFSKSETVVGQILQSVGETLGRSLCWNLGTLGPWNFGTLEPWNLGTLEPWNLGTLEPWNHGTFVLRTLEPWKLGTLEPSNLVKFQMWHYCVFAESKKYFSERAAGEFWKDLSWPSMAYQELEIFLANKNTF